jgi:hypothetical protein
MKKISEAMVPASRMLIHEFSKTENHGKMQATMITMYAGRIRSSRKWRQMVGIADLEVVFEAYPAGGDGLVKMKKVPIGNAQKPVSQA